MLTPIMKHPHSGIVLAGTELQSQGGAFGWVSEGCLRHMGARFLNEKTLGCQWSRLQFEFAIVGDVTIMENIKINQKNLRLTLRGPGRGDGSWKTVPAVLVPLSVSGKTVPTVPVSSSGSVPEPPWKLDFGQAKPCNLKHAMIPDNVSQMFSRFNLVVRKMVCQCLCFLVLAPEKSCKIMG